MGNRTHFEIVLQGSRAWNEWRKNNPKIQPNLSHETIMDVDLSGANFSKTNLTGADFVEVNLQEANFFEANLTRVGFLGESDVFLADFTRANLYQASLGGANLSQASLKDAKLSEACFDGADLSKADLRNAKLIKTSLWEANLNRANLEGADLSMANLMIANLVETNLMQANLTGCRVYGVSTWNVNLKGAKQLNLIITPPGEPDISVDGIEVAQFIYLLLDNKKVRNLIDNITSKIVLILGRFTPKQKIILDMIREKLRKYNYVPIMFDFEKPHSRNFTETVSTLAHLARFIIADFTSPKIVLQEVHHIVTNIAVPVIPLLTGSSREPVVLEDLRKNHKSLLQTYRYKDSDDLIKSLKGKVISPAEAMVRKLFRNP